MQVNLSEHDNTGIVRLGFVVVFFCFFHTELTADKVYSSKMFPENVSARKKTREKNAILQNIEPRRFVAEIV